VRQQASSTVAQARIDRADRGVFWLLPVPMSRVPLTVFSEDFPWSAGTRPVQFPETAGRAQKSLAAHATGNPPLGRRTSRLPGHLILLDPVQWSKNRSVLNRPFLFQSPHTHGLALAPGWLARCAGHRELPVSKKLAAKVLPKGTRWFSGLYIQAGYNATGRVLIRFPVCRE